MKAKWLLQVLATLLVAANSWAGTIYVDAANISGIENGTAAYPFSTIQEGSDAAVAGDDVLVAPGIYYGAIEPKSQVRLISQAGPAQTVIDGMNTSTAVQAPYVPNPSVYVDGFTIRNANELIVATNRVSFWSGSSWTIKNCILIDALYSAIAVYPGAATTIENTLIKNALRGVYSIWCPWPQLRNVTITNVTSAIMPYQNSVSLTNVNISNVENFVELWGSRGSGTIYGSNNNIWNYVNYAVPTWAGNLPYYSMTNNLSADPQYVDAAGGDFRLTAGSPLIDAGTDVGLPYVGGAPDIGAYEFEGVSIPVLLEGLAESYQSVPLPAFKNAGEQRSHALNNKVMAVLEKLNSLTETSTAEEKIAVYSDCINKLQNDILTKADGFYGGNPNNDWIVTQEEQAQLYPKVMELITALQEDMAALQ